jgi:anthranilate synthase/aminodeoxychorismate synthase-like glutamine amidotransferase
MILVIDNFDSFTYNLVQYLGLCGAEVRVFRNDEISLEEIDALRPEGIMLSPGPCTPAESGVCLDILRDAVDNRRTDRPIFGVCLGHQAIGLVTGATIRRARTMMHGKASLVQHDGKGYFEGMPDPCKCIRYHSLVIEESTLSPDLVVTARSTDDDEIMGVRHKSLPIEGVQFHPESVESENGMRIVQNFVDQVRLIRTS